MSEAVDQLWPENTQRLRLVDLEIDLRFRSVHQNGRVTELNQRCFDLLMLFLREPGVVHTREEIFRRIWEGAAVEDANITTTIWMLRKALGEKAKSWVRTVSKQGYVFDPPGRPDPVSAAETPLLDAPPAAAEPLLETQESFMPVQPLATALPAPRRRYLRYWAGVAAVLALAAVTLLFVQPQAPPPRILLVTPPDNSRSEESRWPAELLQAWVQWQLLSLSDRVVVTHVAPVVRSSSDLVLLFSVSMPADRDEHWKVHVQFHGAGQSLDISRTSSSTENLVPVIDEVSREVLRKLAPELPPERPALALNAKAAAALVNGLEAQQRRRWKEAVDAYRAVLDVAPEFGFARMHLAQALAELGQSNAAQTELARAEPWLSRLPTAMQPVFRAQALAIRQDYVGAAFAFGQLWKNSAGERQDLRLAEATNLRRAGRSRDALERLSGVRPDTPALALPWLIERSEIELANRDLGRARVTAQDAIDLARKLGWQHERAQATLLLTDVLSFSGQKADDALYADAIDAFRSSGDELGALRTQVNQELRRPFGPAAPIEHLDHLLAEARAAGNVTVEAEALRRAGLHYLRGGEMQLAQERFEQALVVAETAGDAYLARQVDLHLLRQDALRGDMAALDRRLQDLRADQLQGGMAFWVGLITARLQLRRGQFDAALATVAATEDSLRATEAQTLPQIAVGLACMRATVFISLGRMADAATALQACQSPEVPYFSKHAEIGAAELDILSGNLPEARKHLGAMLAAIEAEEVRPERWSLVVETAPLLARLGEFKRARELLLSVLPEIERSGERVSEADARATLAELDLAEGNSRSAEQQAALIDQQTPADDWIGRRRLRAIQGMIAQAEGRGDDATRELAALHADALAHGDVLTELEVHSLAGASLGQLCSQERYARLLAQSGMRGASLTWMMPQRQTVPTALVQSAK
jgi:cellulose synthase operon protein C